MVRQFGCCVERLAPRCGQLKAKGADVAIGSLTRSPGLHLAFIHGPEGVMVELVQRLDTQAIRVFEGTLKAHELLDACSCGSVTGRPHGNRIGHDRERGLQGRLAQETADGGPIDPSCALALYLAIESDPGCGARGPNPKRRGLHALRRPRSRWSLRPAPIVYHPDPLLEGRSPTSLSPIRRGIVQWHAHSLCD
jgi:hypothetical protein